MLKCCYTSTQFPVLGLYQRPSQNLKGILCCQIDLEPKVRDQIYTKDSIHCFGMMMKKEEIFTLLCFTSLTLRYFNIVGHFIKYNAFVVYCSIESTFIDRGYRITDKHSIDKVRAYQTSKRGDKNTRHISICELHGFLCN